MNRNNKDFKKVIHWIKGCRAAFNMTATRSDIKSEVSCLACLSKIKSSLLKDKAWRK